VFQIEKGVDNYVILQKAQLEKQQELELFEKAYVALQDPSIIDGARDIDLVNSDSSQELDDEPDFQFDLEEKPEAFAVRSLSPLNMQTISELYSGLNEEETQLLHSMLFRYESLNHAVKEELGLRQESIYCLLSESRSFNQYLYSKAEDDLLAVSENERLMNGLSEPSAEIFQRHLNNLRIRLGAMLPINRALKDQRDWQQSEPLPSEFLPTTEEYLAHFSRTPQQFSEPRARQAESAAPSSRILFRDLLPELDQHLERLIEANEESLMDLNHPLKGLGKGEQEKLLRFDKRKSVIVPVYQEYSPKLHEALSLLNNQVRSKGLQLIIKSVEEGEQEVLKELLQGEVSFDEMDVSYWLKSYYLGLQQIVDYSRQLVEIRAHAAFAEDVILPSKRDGNTHFSLQDREESVHSALQFLQAKLKLYQMIDRITKDINHLAENLKELPEHEQPPIRDYLNKVLEGLPKAHNEPLKLRQDEALLQALKTELSDCLLQSPRVIRRQPPTTTRQGSPTLFKRAQERLQGRGDGRISPIKLSQPISPTKFMSL
jgi:hypothetical protein